MPVKQRIDRCIIDCQRIDKRGEIIFFFFPAVQAHESVLLTDKVKNRCIGKESPEQARPDAVKHYADNKSCKRYRQQDCSLFPECDSVKICSVQGTVHVRYVDQEDQYHPTCI